MVKEFSEKRSLIHIKCHEACLNLGFKIYKEDVNDGIILFKVGMTLWSFGEKFKIAISSAEANLTKVEIASEAALAAQIYDWGKNDKNVTNFFQTLKNLLK